METINKRFRELRKTCGRTQAEMGKILGLSTSGVSDIEAERRNVTEQHLIMLSNWKDRSVSIDWLRTGEGEMFEEIPPNDEIALLVSDLLEEENPFFDIILDILRTYNELDPRSQETLMQISEKFKEVVARKRES